MQNDLISRSALIKTFEAAGFGDHSLIESVLAAGVYVCVDNAPTIDAVPVVHGRLEGNHLDFKCSVCGTVFHDDILWIQGDRIVPKYCPECGARWTEVANE